MKNTLLTIFLLYLFPILTLSQDISGNLEGIVIDTIGNPIPGVNISLQSKSLQGSMGTATNEKGYFVIFLLPLGNYNVKISAVGYRELNLTNVQISLGKTTHLGEIKLLQQAIDLPEITISAEKQLIDITEIKYGGNIQVKDFEQLPIDRDYKNIVILFPLANTSYFGDGLNLGNGTGLENRYFIDGVDVTDPNFGMAGTTLPYNFVKEVEIISGGYQAEYRSALGGLINVVTLSGSNELHGSVFGFYTSNGLTAPSKIGLRDPTQGAFSNYDFGFNLNGPILNDALWFNVAYNPVFNRRDVDVPSFGISVDKTVTHSFAGKLTWNVNNELKIALTSSGDPSKRTAIGDAPPPLTNPIALENPDSYFYDKKEGGVNISLNATYLFTNNIFFEASLSSITRNKNWKPATEKGKNEIALVNTETGTWSGGSFGTLSEFITGNTANISGTVLADLHQLKFGVEYRNNEIETDSNFPSYLSRQNDTSYFLLLDGVDDGTVQNRILSGFIQDDWQISDKFRVHAGIRWDGQFIMGGDGNIAQKVLEPFQPRIGFIFLPSANKRHKIFGSFGRYIQEWNTGVMVRIYSGDAYHYEIVFNQDPRVGNPAGDTLNASLPEIKPEQPGMQAQYYDEFSLGYEFMVSDNKIFKLQGIYRSLQEAITVGFVEGRFETGNPGYGILSDFPDAKRDYSALVISLEQRSDERFNFLISYTLSRNYGNYEGLYDSYTHNSIPNANFTFIEVNSLKLATGLLPNDRTHVFKFSGSYRFDIGLIIGSFFTWQTGTPLSEIAGPYGTFLQTRGTSGHTPSIWDLNARLIYPLFSSESYEARVILDIFHIASEREPVEIVQRHYFSVDQSGNPANPNPNYGAATRYQSPMSVRVGMELNF